MVTIARLEDVISEFFKLEASPVKYQSLQQKGRKREKEKPKNEDIGTFSSKNSKSLISGHAQEKNNAVKSDASEKKGMRSCCKYLSEKIGATIAHIQAENLQNV